MTQRALFEKYREPLTPSDPSVPTQDVPRLTGQNALILDALRDGPKTNRQLAFFSLKYTSRISDLRAAGYRVDCTRVKGGLTLYELKESDQCDEHATSSNPPRC